MFKRLFFALLLTTSTSAFAQLSLKEFQENFGVSEEIANYHPPFDIQIRDMRQLSSYKINTEILDSRLRGYTEVLFENSLNEQIELPQLRNKEFIINLEFFNFIESSSKNVILKAIASVYLNGGGYSNLNSEFNISAEEFTSLKLRHVDNPGKASEIASLIEEFSQKFAKKIVDRIQEETKNEEHYVFEITSLGTAVHSSDKSESKKKAIMDALIKASEKAFGTNISNFSEIVDYGDVTDRILAETGGTVLFHKVKEESVIYTKDGYCGLIVKSIIKRK